MDEVYNEFDLMVEQFHHLPEEIKKQFGNYIKSYADRGCAHLPDAIQDKVNHKVNVCPHCGSPEISRNGTNKKTGNQACNSIIS